MKDKSVSVVIPVYNEQETIELLFNQITEVLDKSGNPYEIIVIDDGSYDGTYLTLKSLSQKNKKLKLIKFRRNFGQTSALSAGFHAASGDVIITIDGDLQNDPKDIPRLLVKLEQGNDCVSGWRYKRNDPLIRRISSRIANSVRNWLSGEQIIDVGCSLKAFKSEYVKKLKLNDSLFPVQKDRISRKLSKSNWRFERGIKEKYCLSFCCFKLAKTKRRSTLSSL